MICYVSNVPMDTNTYSFRRNTPEYGCLIWVNVFDEKDRCVFHTAIVWQDQDIEELIGSYLYTSDKVFWEYVDPDHILEKLNIPHDVE